jgi:hypothetical protein
MATSTSPAREKFEISEQSESFPLEERIRLRAYEIWIENGSPMGTDTIDWLEAEQEIVNQENS